MKHLRVLHRRKRYVPVEPLAVVYSSMHTRVVPKASPDTRPALATSLAPFAPFFRRATSRASLERSRTGLLTALPRTPCDTSAAAVAGTSPERLPPLWTAATWEPQARDQQRVTAWVAQSPPPGLVGLDDTGRPKPGRRSVGGARQYSGPLGKVANCQGVVRAHEGADEPTSRAPVPWPLSARLSLPAAWATDGARRATGQVPSEVPVQTQPELARALVEQARAWGVPVAWVVAAAGSGAKPPLLQGLDDRHVADVVGRSSPCGVRRPAEGPAAARVRPSRPRGRGQPKKPRAAPLDAAQAVREAVPQDRWQPSTWRASGDGVLRQQGAAVRGHGATGGAPCSTSHPRVCTGADGGLLGARPVPGTSGACKWYFRPLPADTPRQRLVARAHSRWPIEPFSADAQGAWGLDHSQGRCWDGLHRPLALVMRAYRCRACQRGLPAGRAGFAPLWGAAILPSDPSPGVAVALPRRRVMAPRDNPDRPLSP